MAVPPAGGGPIDGEDEESRGGTKSLFSCPGGATSRPA